jgi:hypothetical protein
VDFVRDLDDDRDNIPAALPDCWSDHRLKWERIVDHFKNSKVSQVGEVSWRINSSNLGSIRTRVTGEDPTRKLTDYEVFKGLSVPTINLLFDSRRFQGEPEPRYPPPAHVAASLIRRTGSDPIKCTSGKRKRDLAQADPA